MRFTFLKQEEFELMSNRFADDDSINYDNWNIMTEEEMLICDAQMFADGFYCDNKFNSIEEFAKNLSKEEGSTVENIIKRLNEMLDKGILKLN